MTDQQKEIRDHSYLIEKCHEIMETYGDRFQIVTPGDVKSLEKIEYGKGKRSTDFIVLGEDTQLELGSPKTVSLSRVLWTKKDDLVRDRIFIAGNDIVSSGKKEISFLQFICVEGDERFEPHESKIFHLKNMTNIIPGLMTRIIPEKMWVRIHRNLARKNFTLNDFGQAIWKTYKDNVASLNRLDIILIADDDELIRKFSAINEMAHVISGENRKLKWEADGIISCEDLSCDVCDEQEACDIIKDIVTERRKKDA